jgi:DNA invertase Pin-like site-specific DNA recombinase
VGTAPRIIGYTRVSTEEQADSGLSLEAQERRIRGYCEAKGWTLVELVRDEATGTNLRRPALLRALRTIAKRQAEGLVATKLDRVSRSSADTAILFEWMRDARATFVLLDIEGLDTSTPIGQAIASFMAIVAQLERDLTAQRTREALGALRRRGLPTGRPAVADHPALQKRIRREREQGATLQAIADGLNRDEIPTLRGAERWTTSSVQSASGYQRPAARRPRAVLPTVKR